jgi:hypothetical protein
VDHIHGFGMEVYICGESGGSGGEEFGVHRGENTDGGGVLVGVVQLLSWSGVASLREKWATECTEEGKL